MQYKVIATSPIWVKTEPDNSARNVSVLHPGTIITTTKTQDTWLYIESGWVNTLSSDGEFIYITKLEETEIYDSPTISVGDTVSISTGDAKNLNTGDIITNTEKSVNYKVTALSDDGKIALLNNDSDTTMAVGTYNLKREASQGRTVPAEEVNKPTESNTDSNKYDNSGADGKATNGNTLSDKTLTFFQEMFSDPVDYFEKQGAESFKKVLDKGISIASTRGIFGMPYQYMSIADRRIPPSENESPSTETERKSEPLGRKYAEKIVSRMPLLVITPGLPEFLPGQSEEDKNNVVQWAVNAISGSNETDLENLIKRSGKYYTLRPDRPNYFNHVNPMCRVGASFLNLQNTKLDGVELSKYDWDKHVNTDLNNTFTYKSGVAFYIHSDTQVSDSFSNDDTRSQLADKINSMSDMGREMNFLLGTLGSQTGVEWDKFTSQKAVAQNQENQEAFRSSLIGSSASLGSWFKNITNQMSVVAAGGKLVFPNIWSGSSFSRSYDVTIKLVSPDYDIYSWYLNIFVPLMHLFGFVLPRQAGPNGFISPFLIKAYYKGLFNCDLGLITNMSVSRGSEGGWTRNGLPTTVDVSLQIKDLYENISITKYGAPGEGKLLSPTNNIISNIILMDYIANLCGININKPDIKRMLDFYYTQGILNQVKDKVRLDVFGGFDQWFTNKMMGVYNSR